MNNPQDFCDSRDYCVIKRLFVKAEESGNGNFDLVAYLDVKVTGATKEGTKESFSHEYQVEVYRIPFPFDLNLRKTIIRMFKKNPKYFVAE